MDTDEFTKTKRKTETLFRPNNQEENPLSVTRRVKPIRDLVALPSNHERTTKIRPPKSRTPSEDRNE